MKKIIPVFLALALTFSGIASGNIFAADIPDNIRVGLTYKYKDVDSIPISNRNISIGYAAEGRFFESTVLVASESFSVIHTSFNYVKLNTVFDNYISAGEMASAMKAKYGYHAVPCLTGDASWTVYLGGSENEADVIAANNAVQEDSVIVKTGARRVALMDGGVAALIFDSDTYFPQIGDAEGGFIKLGDRKFRDRIEFGRYTGQKLTAVNVIGLDKYLYSAVPSEMPSGWHIEALKAQACAARNYTITAIGKHKEGGYDVCDSIHCQVYLGADNEAESAIQAVEATDGILIYYDSKPIDAVFFSSSGGMTDASENVWPNSLPYLRPVKEINETMAKEWTRVITLAELDKVLTANNAGIGKATGMHIASYNSSGRVGELIITGTNGNKSLTKEQIRTYFSSLSGGSLESRNFSVSVGSAASVSNKIYITDGENVIQENITSLTVISSNDINSEISAASGNITVIGSSGSSSYPVLTSVISQNTGTDIIIIGKGWGHAVGMSQFGAKGMAELGYTFDQILKHYYTGVEVR